MSTYEFWREKIQLGAQIIVRSVSEDIVFLSWWCEIVLTQTNETNTISLISRDSKGMKK